MRVLVTGATGYIGGQWARRLQARGEQVRCLVRAGQQAPEGCEAVYGDLLDPGSLAAAVAGIEVVAHCAGRLGRWGLPEAEIRAINVDGPQHLLRAARAAGVAYFLHLSTCGVVGPRGPEPAHEGSPCYPRTDYERSKFDGERALRRLARELGQPVGIARPTFTYGPGDPHKLGLFKAIQKGIFFYIDGGRSTNHPVYIEDLLDGLDLLMARRPQDEVFILGGPRPVSKREWGETIAAALGVRPPWITVPAGVAWGGALAAEAVGRRLGREPQLTRSRVLAFSRWWGMDIGKARRVLGYEPRVDLAEGVARTVAWYRREGWLA